MSLFPSCGRTIGVGLSIFTVLGLLSFSVASPVSDTASSKLAFSIDAANNLAFDTGIVKGSLQKDGNGEALTPISYVNPRVVINNTPHGLLTPYRFLTPQKRYGFGSWEWPRTGSVLPDGSARLDWTSAPDRPFAFSTHYQWKSADTLDFTVSFTPETNLENFELFLGSYFLNFKTVKAFVKKAGDGQPGFVAVSDQIKNGYQYFPVADHVKTMINDGRYNFPPFPITWTVREPLAVPLGLMADRTTGVTILLMSPPEDCFALSATKPSWKQGAYYMSLFGKNIAKGQTAIAHVRLVFGRNITDRQAVSRYAAYLKEIGVAPEPAVAAALKPPAVKKDWIVADLPKPDGDGWTTLFDGKHLFGATISDDDLNSGKIRLQQDGTLRLDSTDIHFAFKGHDVAIKAEVKKLRAQNCSLTVRFDRGGDRLHNACIGWFNGGNFFGIGKVVDGPFHGLVDVHSQDSYNQFFWMELDGQGPNLTLKANDQIVCQARDPAAMDGQICLGVLRGQAIVKNIRARILPTESAAAK